MKKISKRVLAVILTLAMLLPMLTIGISASETITTGECGENIKWTMDSVTGTMTLSGIGQMYNYAAFGTGRDYPNNMTTLIVEEGITALGDFSFDQCKSLKNVVLPNSLKKTGMCTFRKCPIESINIPNGLTNVGNYTFDSTELLSVYVPGSVVTLGDSGVFDEHAFFNCRQLQNIIVDVSNANYASVDGVLFNKAANILYQYPSGRAGDYTVPNGTTELFHEAFYGATKLTAIYIPKSVTKIGQQCFMYCTSLKDIYYDGTKENWDRISNNSIASNVTIHYNQKMFPDGYNFETDSYSFGNYGRLIGNEYFKTMFGDKKGLLFWKKLRNQGGQCFGMAYTTAAFLNDLPGGYTIRELKNGGNDIVNWSSSVKIGTHTISIRDYIAYAHIYQFSTNVTNGSVWTNGTTIYNLVRQYLSNDTIGVTIGMTRRDGSGGHRVLAVGIDGNDILIDDPNNTKSWERLTVNSDGSWSFSGLNGWNSDTCDIRYNLDWQMPYEVLKTGTTVVGDDVFINDESSCENYIVGMDIVDKDKLLLFADGDYTVCNENASQIVIDSIDENITSSSGEFYWIDKDKTINVTTQQDDNEIILAGNDVSIGVETDAASSMTFTLDEGNEVAVSIDCNQSDEYKIYFETTDDNENDVITTITGTASGDTVTAYEVEGGIEVEGLNDITVTLETADGTIETTAKVTDGEKVNITVDEANNTVSTDWQCKHPDTNHDGVCDNCGEDFTKSCSHICHSNNKFIQFIYKIACFVCRIFGVNKYCACGKAHY